MQPVFSSGNKTVIFFDLHDTLIDREQSFIQALGQSLDEFTARWDEPGWSSSQAVQQYMKEWRKKSAKSQTAKGSTGNRGARTSFEHRQLDCLTKALAGCPFKVTDSFLTALLKQTRELVPHCSRLFPDVPETLEQLGQCYRLAILSNGSRERLDITLKAAGLSHLFPRERIFVPSNRKMKKPHPDIFQKALVIMGIQPSKAVMVGNSWNNDIFGANRCGLDAVWIRRKNKKMLQQRIGKNKVIFISRCKQLLSVFKH